MHNYYRKRKNRRRAVIGITRSLKQILDMELDYYYSISDSPASEDQCIESELLLATLKDVVETLKYIY
jgi:hypothetical protein